MCFFYLSFVMVFVSFLVFEIIYMRQRELFALFVLRSCCQVVPLPFHAVGWSVNVTFPGHTPLLRKMHYIIFLNQAVCEKTLLKYDNSGLKIQQKKNQTSIQI